MDNTVVGTYGGDGQNAGLPGGPGGAAIAIAASSTDTEDTATAYGGGGGTGGSGYAYNENNAGAGGAAGNATATATTNTALASGSGTVEATATADGGQGGSAGFPWIYNQGGTGNVGTGGGASLGASATAINTAGDAIASAYGTGGQGGGSVPDYPPNPDGSYSGGDYIGGHGGIATGTTAFAEGLTSAEAQAVQTGGSGSVGVQGGRGADSNLTNAVNAIVGAGGDIYLTQTATAGSGGNGDYGVGGVGGAASSSLTFNDTTNPTQAAAIYATVEADAGSDGGGTTAAATGGAATATGAFTGAGNLNVEVVAKGGGGGSAGINYDGDYDGGKATDGAAASATGTAATTSATGNVALTVTAKGGDGGGYGIYGLPDGGGDGADVTAVSASATGGATATITADAQGGYGGDSEGGLGGNGGAATLNNAARGTTVGGTLQLNQTADGGRGGAGELTPSYAYDPNVQGTQGAGGNASSTISFNDSFSKSQSQSIHAYVDAQGGNGGEATLADGSVVIGAGGSAVASESILMANTLASGAATSLEENVNAETGDGDTAANATATATGIANTVQIDAFATAVTHGNSLGTATAVAAGNALSGSLQAFADTSSAGTGPISEMTAQANTPAAGDTSAFASAGFGGAASFNSFYNALSNAVGLPAAVPDGTGLTLGTTDLLDWTAGGIEPPGTTAPSSYSESTLSVTLNLADLSLGGDLELYLNQGVSLGSGVTGVNFVADVEGSSAEIVGNFTSAAQAEVFFTHNLINFGPIDDLTSSTTSLTLSFTLVVVGDPPGAGFFGELEAGGTLACYCRGTRILTPGGEVAVEDLAAGDLVTTADGRHTPITWAGRRRLHLGHAAAGRPIRIAAGALAGNVPHRDLYVSPDHALYLRAALIPAQLLLNGRTITQPPRAGWVDYFHLEVAPHDLILAEGAAAETYLDIGNTGHFGIAGQPGRGRAEPKTWEDACAPLLLAGPALDLIRRDLTARATHLRATGQPRQSRAA